MIDADERSAGVDQLGEVHHAARGRRQDLSAHRQFAETTQGDVAAGFHSCLEKLVRTRSSAWSRSIVSAQ